MRKIIHIDMDCFFAAVEMRDHPEWRDIPIAIGGSADRRGVIATCNYPAREYGVRSAMATAYALRLCPQLLLVPGRMELYRQVSAQIRQIFSRYTDLIEPLSLDEAYLDVTHCLAFNGSATLIAQDIRAAIYRETGLTASAGVAPCKFVAKIASDENKPDGIRVVTPEQLDDYVRQLPLELIPGVGKVTAEKLAKLGLLSCEDVRQSNESQMVEILGKFGKALWQRAHSIDERPVSNERQRKSVGAEVTLPQDIYTRAECWQVIERLYDKLEARLKAYQPDLHIYGQGLKLKFDDFRQTTVEHRQLRLSRAYFGQLLDEGLSRQQHRGIRLVGMHVTLPTEPNSPQLALPLES
ncbi:DNA-directed DNA polymerase [Saliniradius amylolyticus]|uniref:DNA polymerase IV n=1 Tax=Saliniradius amylolyticus TaxID=2183582 RepID=A0A2S2E025_9ALTE|nr:DNA polymerase IV [Saliniradius amylolyticus]AWL10963.1 DNA-directed DNA polymerase [Saliniradius amylolyticus]